MFALAVNKPFCSAGREIKPPTKKGLQWENNWQLTEQGAVRQWGCGAARQIQRECHRMPGQNQVNLVIKLCSLAANYVRRSPNDPCKQHYWATSGTLRQSVAYFSGVGGVECKQNGRRRHCCQKKASSASSWLREGQWVLGMGGIRGTIAAADRKRAKMPGLQIRLRWGGIHIPIPVPILGSKVPLICGWIGNEDSHTASVPPSRHKNK